MTKNKIFCPAKQAISKASEPGLIRLSDASDRMLYASLNASNCMVAGARFVDSYEDIFKLSDSFNTDYNRFPVFTMFTDEMGFFQLEFSLYINRNMKEFYMRFDDIPYGNLRLKDKDLPLSSCRISFSHPDQDIENFADSVLLNDILEYYKDSDISISNPELYYMDGDSGANAVIAFGQGIRNLRFISSMMTSPENNEKITITKNAALPYSRPLSMYYAESLDGKFRYLRDHRFLWYHSSVNRYLFETVDNPFFIKSER